MKGKIEPQKQDDLFRSRLSSIINLDHELCRAAAEIQWEWIEQELAEHYSEVGRPSVPLRTMVGLLLLKQLFNQSDESVIERWIENPYWQHFTGETFFQHKQPFDPSDFVHFRKRVGERGMEKILSLTVRLHYGSESEAEVHFDTTVQQKNITFPTDDKLAFKIIKSCWKMADSEKISLRQSYRLVLKDLRLAMHNSSHRRRLKKAKKARKKVKNIAGRLVRDVKRKLAPSALERHGADLELFAAILAQKPQSQNKRYSIHEKDVWCIAKGKAHKKYEFGCKVAVTKTAKSGVIVGIKSFQGNPYDGDTLEASLEQAARIRRDAGGNRPMIATTDRGCRGRKSVGETQILIPGKPHAKLNSYQKQKVRARFRRRAGIEPVIAHLKYDHRMLTNFLKGAIGDAVNCLLAGAAFNLKKRLNQLKAQIFALIQSMLAPFRWHIA